MITRTEDAYFSTYRRLKEANDALFSGEAFLREYAEESGRTPEQIRSYSNDIVRQCLRTRFAERKLRALREAMVAESARVIAQTEAALTGRGDGEKKGFHFTKRHRKMN